MGLTGKYNFKGIKEKGARVIKTALAASPYTAWLLKFNIVLDLALEAFSNWLANKGLIIMNVGYFYVDGKLDQAALDRALNRGIEEVDSGKILTPEQMKEIDDAVIKAANEALPYGKPPK